MVSEYRSSAMVSHHCTIYHAEEMNYASKMHGMVCGNILKEKE